MSIPGESLGPGLRHAASALRQRADQAGSVANQVANSLATMTYAGPAADRFRASANRHHGELLKVNSILGQLADAMVQAAAEEDARAARGGFF